jgi:hypothetical protein
MRLALLCFAVLWASPGVAAPTWTVLPLDARGVDRAAVATFRDLLISELGTRNRARFVDGARACNDVPCAQQAGRKTGASMVVYGRLSTLGRNIIITLTTVDVRKGIPWNQQRMGVSTIEDLEPAAARLAEAIITNRPVEQTARLGQITRREVRPDRRRRGYSGPSLRLGGGGHLDRPDIGGGSLRFQLGWWYEARHFAIEPAITWRMAPDEPGYSNAFQVDIGAYWIPGTGDVTPFIGAGGGIRRVQEGIVLRENAGQVIQLETETEVEDDDWGGGAFGRVGLLFFRTYDTRMIVSVDYDVTFAELHGSGPIQLVQGAVGILF